MSGITGSDIMQSRIGFHHTLEGGMKRLLLCLAVEYAFPNEDKKIAFFVPMDISLSRPDYGSIGLGSRVYLFGIDGDGIYISPMANVLLDGILTNYAVSLDGGYRFILFDFLTGFAEAGGVMNYDSYAGAATLGFFSALGWEPRSNRPDARILE